MMEMIITACLLGDVVKCKEFHYEADYKTILPQVCMIAAQTDFLQRFRLENPKWKFVSYKCKPVRKAKQVPA